MGKHLRQRRSLGQVFLKQDWPVERIVALLRQMDVKRVLEIGPGAGVLTRALLANGFHVTAVEKDRRFSESLEDSEIGAVADQGRLHVVHGDILNEDLSTWVNCIPDEPSDESPGESPNESIDGRVDRQGPPKSAICGNIPYYISSPIVQKVVPHLRNLGGAILMTQLEFARRLQAEPGTKDYGSLSVFAQLRAQVSLAFEVPRTCFKPVPRVDSAVVVLRALDTEYCPAVLTVCEELCRAAFSQRRKKLKNSIAPFLENQPNSDNLTAMPIDLSLRADAIAPDQFYRLAEYLSRS